jgi:hypothetical protein
MILNIFDTYGAKIASFTSKKGKWLFLNKPEFTAPLIAKVWLLRKKVVQSICADFL